MSKDIKKDFGGIKALEADAHAKQVAAGVQLMNKQREQTLKAISPQNTR